MLHIQGAFKDFNEFNAWIKSPTRGQFRKKVVCVALIYHIWQQRKKAIWDARILLPRKVVDNPTFSFIIVM